ncbi:hypothetical protein JTL87_25275, partial [Pseudomonas aeruginosa]|nr:hypothetical protein [Pseudomonas aeruginosa]
LLLFAGELGFGEGDLHGYGLSLDELGYFTKICAGDGVCSAPPWVYASLRPFNARELLDIVISL